MWECLQPCPGESVLSLAKANIPGLYPNSLRQCQPLTHHPTHSPCYAALLIKQTSEDICFSSPQERKCNGHLPQASDRLGSFRSHHSGLLVISCEGDSRFWAQVGWGTLRCFHFWICNLENLTLSPGTILPFGNPAQVDRWISLALTAISTLLSIKCLRQQGHQ